MITGNWQIEREKGRCVPVLVSWGRRDPCHSASVLAHMTGSPRRVFARQLDLEIAAIGRAGSARGLRSMAARMRAMTPRSKIVGTGHVGRS